MNKLFIKNIKRLIFLLVITFAACDKMPVKKAITYQEYAALMDKKITHLNDVINLFPKTVQEIQLYAQHAMDLCKDRLDDLLSIDPEKRTVRNTMYAFDTLQQDIYSLSSIIEIIEMVSPDEQLRTVAHEVGLQLKSFCIATFSDKRLYKAYAELDSLVKDDDLSDEEAYVLAESLDDFKRAGFTLPEDEFAKLTSLKKELSAVAAAFDKNINSDDSKITAASDELDGLSKDFVAGLKQDDRGLYVLGCDYPTYFEVMDHAKNSQLRKRLYFAFNNRAYPANKDVLNQMRELRNKIATLLGYKTFAHLDLDNEMVKTPERAQNFLQGLIKKARSKMNAELDAWIAHAQGTIELSKDGLVLPWDIAFIKSQYKKDRLAIDDREIAQYFPMQQAIDGMFAIYQKFLNLTFTQVKPSWTWHEDVLCVEVKNTQDGALRGYIFLDLYPRPYKYSHACHAGFVSTQLLEGGEVTPSAAVVIANFPKPEGGKPALLKFSDVETFFHEFGHAMHNLLGSTQLREVSGTSVKLDFVEMPSQMFEEWLYDTTILSDLARHYKTGEPLPQRLIDALINLKTFDAGFFLIRQVIFSQLSLQLHMSDAAPDDLYADIIAEAMPQVYLPQDVHTWASFGHLSGYSARYYGYMWSKVFALDLFSKVKKGGLLNPENGAELIKKVLGRGGSADPNLLLKDYLGREPNDTAFFQDLGL